MLPIKFVHEFFRKIIDISRVNPKSLTSGQGQLDKISVSKFTLPDLSIYRKKLYI